MMWKKVTNIGFLFSLVFMTVQASENEAHDILQESSVEEQAGETLKFCVTGCKPRPCHNDNWSCHNDNRPCDDNQHHEKPTKCSAVNEEGLTRYGFFVRIDDQEIASGEQVIFQASPVWAGLSDGNRFVDENSSVGFYYPGVYLVLFTVSGASVNQFGLTVNNIPVPFTTFTSGVAGTETVGMALVLNTLPARSVAELRVVNNRAATVTISVDDVENGGSANAASLTIVGLSSSTVS